MLKRNQASTERLAVYGGPTSVTWRYTERWRQVSFGAIRSILWHALRDKNTRAGGGGQIGQFERQFASMSETNHALLVNSGTAALHSAYLAVGVSPGDEVIVPAYTFFATAAPILACGGRPVFCEIDERTLTADPDDVEKRITPKTRAICVVHVWGNPARLDRFVEIAKKHNLALIEDCSHAHGATYQGRPVGSWGDIGCFSLQGQKPVSGGEMGIATTNDDMLYDRMLAIGHFARPLADQKTGAFDIGNFSLGLKYRPHLYGVILANKSLKRLPELNRLRRRNYEILGEELEGCPAVQLIETYPDAVRGGMLEYILKYSPEHAAGLNLGSFVTAVAAEGVPLIVDRYTRQLTSGTLLHRLPLFRKPVSNGLGGCFEDADPSEGDSPEDLPVSDALARRLMSLPPFTKVSEKFVRQCARGIRKVAEGYPQINDLRLGR